MEKQTIAFSSAETDFYFGGNFKKLDSIVPRAKTFIITDENIFALHAPLFDGWNVIQIPSGENYKTQATVDSIIQQLIEKGADRSSWLVGVGGGVVTDITGYVAAVYMRGIAFGFVPTTILAMVDAAIGGKNGVDVGVYKNMVGTIRQPQFLLYSMGFLKSLPDKEWSNGFAEIIKHAAIKDAVMFDDLEKNDLLFYQQNEVALSHLIQQNVLIKAGVVQRDEWEKGERRLLNFGHTLAHALEKKYDLMHGEAVAIGMNFAAALSQKENGFSEKERLKKVIENYQLPTQIDYNKETVFEILQRDKKQATGFMHFILLRSIGEAYTEKIELDRLKKYL